MLENLKGVDSLHIQSSGTMVEKANWKPEWKILKYDKDMKLYEEEDVKGNILLNEGIESLLRLLIGTSEKAFNTQNAHIGVGNSDRSEKPDQTGLIGSTTTYAKMDYTYPKIEGTSVIFRSTFGPNEGNYS